MERRVRASIVDATTAVPLDEVVRQDRPGVKITYRGNLSETGSISRLGGQQRRTGASWNKNAPLSLSLPLSKEMKERSLQQEGGWDNALPISR